jgi:OPA family glycerol-3-phosphate transporter-like MFS transporter
LLVVGYSGYYLCRSNLSVVMPMIADELAASGIDRESAKASLGSVASIGVFAYALGKFFSGPLADRVGGKRNFLGGMAGTVGFTLLFALGVDLSLFLAAWCGNRLAQSLGWAGMVKIISRWFSPMSYGSAMAVVSLSYLFGDAVARSFLGALIELGLGWRGLFAASAGVLTLIGLACVFLLRESPGSNGSEGDGGHLDRAVAPDAGEPDPGEGVIGPLFRNPSFWIVCGLSLGVTLLRETFNTWTPTYFVESAGLSKSAAARASSLFPLAGGASVLLAGLASDRLGRPGRGAILLLGLALAGGTLAALGLGDFRGSSLVPVALVTAVAFFLIGPYSYLAGATALDFGGRKGGATASGLIDGIGYLGGVLAGRGMADLASSRGWSGAFLVLAGVAGCSSLAAAALMITQRGSGGRPMPAIRPVAPPLAAMEGKEQRA